MDNHQPKKLNLPDVGPTVPPSIKTMDEVVAWIDEMYELFFDRETYDEEKRRLSVSKPFRLRPKKSD